MDHLPASYYGAIDKSNPVISTLHRELKKFRYYMKKISDTSTVDHLSYSRGCLKLFEIWTKFQPRLPTHYYEETLIKTADFLLENKFYRLALWQGYRFYLQQYCKASLESIKDVDHFKQTFFPHGFDTEGTKLMLRALYGECQCSFLLEKCRWADRGGVQKLLGILTFLRIMMQAILPHENLCYLLYNGSLHIYNISRFLMSVNHATKAVEFLLWASVCLETSVPLLMPSFLPWRTTLYFAVCVCYYDGCATAQAEVFARRALGKINDLVNLQDISGPQTAKTNRAIREAIVKLSVMVFKRSVYEPQKHPRGLFKPKRRRSLKQTNIVPWPRTMTERMLMELFEGHAAQFFAVLEALWDPSRRPLQSSIPDKPEHHKVALELMSAGISILSGVGGSSDQVQNDMLPSAVKAVIANSTLMELATAGKNQVSVSAAVKFVKLLFRYEQWDMFCSLSDNLLTVLSNLDNHHLRKDELELTLLKSVERLMSAQRTQLGTNGALTDEQRERRMEVERLTEEFLNLAQTLHLCVCETAKDIQPDVDLVVDTVLFLWAKCKPVFEETKTKIFGLGFCMSKIEKEEKWIQGLFLLCEVAHVCQVADVYPVMVSEMTLRLAMVMEANVDSRPLSVSKKGTNEFSSILSASPKDSRVLSTSAEKDSATEYGMTSQTEQLKVLHGVLERGLECVSRGRGNLFLPGDASAIFDTVFLQKFGGEHLRCLDGVRMESTSIRCMNTFSMDMHIELLAFQHRISFKLLESYVDEESTEQSRRSVASNTQGQNLLVGLSMRATAETVLLGKIKKNKISKALLLMEKASLFYKKDLKNTNTKTLLEEALGVLEKAEIEERRLVSASAPVKVGLQVGNSCRPSPPILLSRTNRSMTFTPAPFALEDQVCWYRIYGKEAEGVNVKVRIGDCHLVGTGEMIPSGSEVLFHISGLEPNQKYLFAVAAYDAKGNLIGNTIGHCTIPLLASLPLPLLTTWGHLALVSYQTGQYAIAKRVCNDIWSHFTLPTEPSMNQDEKDEQLGNTRLRPEILQLSSPILQQLFLTSLFIHTDIQVKENDLYCDSLCNGSPLIWGQEARLAECERMLVALDMALHLNDSSAALQAVVTCYDLLTPLIYYHITTDRATQVLLKCMLVLQEIPGALKKKRPAPTNETQQNMTMVACITHYVATGLQSRKEYRMASYVVEQGKNLLQEIGESLPRPTGKAAQGNQVRMERLQKKALTAQKEKLNELLKDLEITALKYNKMAELMNIDAASGTPGSHGDILLGQEDPIVLYTVIAFNPLSSAFRDVLKFKRRSCFLEFATLIMQKALQDNELELLIDWEQDVFSWLSRRDRSLLNPKDPNRLKKSQKKFGASVIEYDKDKEKNGDVMSEKKMRELRMKIGVQDSDVVWQQRDYKAVETLLNLLAPLVRRNQQRWKMRRVFSEGCQWRCQLNLTMAQAYLGLLRESLKLCAGAPLQPCYSKMPPLHFSLAHSGTLVKWKHIPHRIRTPELFRPIPRVTTKLSVQKTRATIKGATFISEESRRSVMDSDVESPRSQMTIDSDSSKPSPSVTPTRSSTTQPLDTLCKASAFIRRAMVLAHRGGHWTSLQWACGIMWHQLSNIALLVEHCQTSDSSSKLTLDQFYIVITPLMVLASELLMDMMEKLQHWKVYKKEGEDLDAQPFSTEGLVDLRWVRNLVLNTLELLHHQARWETLAHLALLYNSYTQERYTYMITPLLVHAQRRLLERISHFGGPPVPQPHFTHTETVTQKKVTCRSYAGRQLLIPRSSRRSVIENQTEVERAMCLVRVPLDIEDTLCCFREMLDKQCPTMRMFLHSRSLLLLLLADTQYTSVPSSYMELRGTSQSRVEFSVAASTAPTVGPPDLSNEDFSSLGSVYSSPLTPSHIQTVISSYNSSIKYLEANKNTFLQVEALHDLGNLHFYNGNQMAALTHWRKGLDCALQTTQVLESWDGESWGSQSSEDPLRHAGIWGCFQGAVLSARIAQYIYTSEISQRTKCCLLSAKLFKCLLRTSLPHPEEDLQYGSYTVKTELIPGMDIFSEAGQGIAANSVSSLSFLCHWLYTCGHHLTVLPLLVLLQYAASKLCREPKLTVHCRILKVKALAELCLFAEAVREIHSLTLGEDVPLSFSGYKGEEKYRTHTQFISSKPLIDPLNIEVMKEVLNIRPSEDIISLYGTKLIHHLFLARIHIVLAMCRTVYVLPAPLSPDTEELEPQEHYSEISSPRPTSDESLSSSPVSMSSESPGLKPEPQREKLTLGLLKAFMLREASRQLGTQLFTLRNIHMDPEELELAVETRLVLSSVSLEQGKAASSANMAVSAMRLLQDSPLFLEESLPQLPPTPLPSALRLSSARSKDDPYGLQMSLQVHAPDPQLGDIPAAVEATERMGRCLWLRCRLAVVQSLAAYIPGAAIFPSLDISKQAETLLNKGLAEAEAWGDPDTQALLLLQRVILNTHCGRTPEESASTLQEAVSLLSGRRSMSLHAGMALAKATLLLSELKETGRQPLLLVTQKLLQQQLSSLGECITLKAGGSVELPSSFGLKNIYHPQLPLLVRTTMHLGQCLFLQTVGSSTAVCEEPLKPWHSVLGMLQSAGNISKTSASRNPQLEADILYCRGLVEKVLLSLGALQYQVVVETFMESIMRSHAHSPNLKLIHRCYLQMALIYLQQWQKSSTAPADQTPAPAKRRSTPGSGHGVKSPLNKNLTVSQTQMLLFWVCLRAAMKTIETIASCTQLPPEGTVPLMSLRALPEFALNDLLHPYGTTEAMEEPAPLGPSPTPDPDSKRLSQLTWLHLSRYYTQLLHLRHINTQTAGQCVESCLSAVGDPILALKIGQLTAYRAECKIPEPPVTLILEPQTVQLSHAAKQRVFKAKQPVLDLYPWATVDTQQLCMQWHRPTLERNRISPNTIVLLFALNKTPLSVMRPSAVGINDLVAGQRLVPLDGLNALHSQLITACMELPVSGRASPLYAGSQCTTRADDESPTSRTGPQRQTLLEKTRQICSEIRNLLVPDSESSALTEVTFELTAELLCDLESCFNPETGGILIDRVLTDWLSSVLIVDDKPNTPASEGSS